MSTTTHTGSNKAVEKSFNSFFLNNGCFNEAAGRGVKMRYRTRFWSTKTDSKKKGRSTYIWATPHYRIKILLPFFPHVPWFYKLSLSKTMDDLVGHGDTTNSGEFSGHPHCRTCVFVLYGALMLSILATRMVPRE